jgi:hypothetical protein
MYSLDLISWWDVSTYIFCVSGKVTLLSASGRPLPHPLSHVTQLPSSTSILLAIRESLLFQWRDKYTSQKPNLPRSYGKAPDDEIYA